MKVFIKLTVGLVLLFSIGIVLAALRGEVDFSQHWSSADRASAGIAPDPAAHPEALVLVFAARAYNWRGLFAVHTWIATKEVKARHYVIHEVVGWRAMRGQPALASRPDVPDRSWFGNPPALIGSLSGPEAAAAIRDIHAANRAYPYAGGYRLWPGPNSNSYVAYIGRRVPQIRMALPATAIGKDYLAEGDWWGPTPSGTGRQISWNGLLGAGWGRREGFEINILGAVFGIDILRPAITLPGIGRIGLPAAA